MLKIVGTLPVKTRLPFAAWALAGLVTLVSLVNSLAHINSSIVEAAKPATVLQRRTQTDDYVLLAQAWRAANTKARELGWIV